MLFTCYGRTASAATSAASSATALSPTSPSPLIVTVYNGQGRVVFQAADLTTPELRINTQDWPEGLYQVVRQQAGQTTRQQLSIQH